MTLYTVLRKNKQKTKIRTKKLSLALQSNYMINSVLFPLGADIVLLVFPEAFCKKGYSESRDLRLSLGSAQLTAWPGDEMNLFELRF